MYKDKVLEYGSESIVEKEKETATPKIKSLKETFFQIVLFHSTIPNNFALHL